MAKSSGRSDGESGNRNKMMLIAAVVILAAAGGWFYLSRPKNLDEQTREVFAQKRAETPQVAKSDSPEVDIPAETAAVEGEKKEAGTSDEQPAEETAEAPKQKRKPKTKQVF